MSTTFTRTPETEVSLKIQALDDLQRAWKSLRRTENASQAPEEFAAAGRARGFVDKAIAELEILIS